MITKYEKANRGKLLAAVLVLAMVLAGAAVVFSDSEVNAADTNVSGVTVTADADTVSLGNLTNTSIGNGELTVTTTENGAEITGELAYIGDPSDLRNMSNDMLTDIQKNYIGGGGAPNGYAYAFVYQISGLGENYLSRENFMGTDWKSVKYDNGTVEMLQYISPETATGSYTYYITSAQTTSAENALSQEDVKTLVVSWEFTFKDVTTADDFKTAIGTGNVALGADVTVTAADVTSTDYKVYVQDNVLTITGDGTAISNLTVIGAGGSYVTISSITLGKDDTLSVTSGSIEINGNVAEPIDGKIIINGDGVVNGDTVFNGTIELADANSTLIIPEGTTLTVNKITSTSNAAAKVIVNGNLVGTKDDSKVSDVITVEVTSTGSISGISANTQFSTDDPQFRFEGYMSQDVVVSTEQSLTGDLYITEGFTLSIQSGGVLNLNGYGIYVEGTLAVDANGSIKNFGSAQSEYGNKIILYRTGVIENNGIIGSGCEITITAAIPNGAGSFTESPAIKVPTGYAGKGSVTLKDVAGVTFAVEKVSGETSSYQLTISGDLISYGMSGSYTVSAEDVQITGDMNIGDGVVFTSTKNVKLSKDATLSVNGTMKNGENFIMTNGSTMVVYGAVDKVTAETGDYQTSTASEYTFVNTSVTLGNITNIELTVGQYAYSKNDNGTTVPWTMQRLYLNGTVSEIDEDDTPSFAITGNYAYVADDATLAIGELKMNGTITVLGQIQYTGSADNVPGYIGTKYAVVDATDKTKKTTYITTFDKAYAEIANAENNRLTVKGNYEFDSNLTLTDGQKIVAASGTVFNIDENAVVTVEKGASITGTIQKVDGVLTINTGASCPTPKEYAVMKRGTDFVQYSGLVPAINNATAGDVIDVKMATTVENDLTVPAGVTVNIDGVEVKFMKNLTIAETAKVVNEGTINMAGEKSRIVNNGELDSSEGTIEFTATVAQNDSRSFQSVGTATLTATNYSSLKAWIVGAVYTNEDSKTIVTSFAKAASAVDAQDTNKTITIVGKLNEAGDVTVGEGITVNVTSESSLGTITISDKSVINANAKITADIVGMTGADGSTIQSSIALQGATGVHVGMYSFTSSDNVRTTYLYIYGDLKGQATVETGTVNVGTTENGKTELSVTYSSGDKTANVLTVASGATLAVDKVNNTTMELTVGTNPDSAATVVVEGTVTFNGGAYTDNSGIMSVSGTMIVGDETEITVSGTLNVAGTLQVSNTSEKEGQVSVSGTIVIGTASTTLGAGGAVSGEIEITNYVKAYAGSDVTNAKFVDNAGNDAKYTQFYINGDLYMTAYGSATYSTVVNDEPFDIDGYNTANAKKISEGTTYYWFTDANLTKGATATSTLGTDPALYFKAVALKVDVSVSVGSGISIYIDDVKVSSGTPGYTLSVGTHTVTATVNPGYKGDVTITFNGQTVTNGQFTITPEMASEAYEGTVAISATGDISVDMGSTGSSDDGGMGIVEILLIILVVVVVILAIFVVLRMMRS